jgi:hypothetical protein
MTRKRGYCQRGSRLTTKQGSQLAYQVVTTEKQRFVPLSPHRASKAGRGVTDRNLRGFSEEGVHTRLLAENNRKTRFGVLLCLIQTISKNTVRVRNLFCRVS